MTNLDHLFGLSPEQEHIRKTYAEFAKTIEPLVQDGPGNMFMINLAASCRAAVENAKPAPKPIDENLPDIVKKLLGEGNRPYQVEAMPDETLNVVWDNDDVTNITTEEFRLLKEQLKEEIR